MRVLFISQWDMNPEGRYCGSAKKTLEQIDCLNKLGIQTDLYNEITIRKDNFLEKITSRIPYMPAFNTINYNDKINGYDAYYIRFLGSDYYLYKFINKIRKNNRNSKILIEFPDVDYMSHIKKNIKNIPFYIKNNIFIYKISKIIDRSVTMYNDNKYQLFKNIFILNGIDITKIKIIENSKEFDKNTINLGVVGSFQPVHGIDLLLESLGEYYKKDTNEKNIRVHIVGDGPDINLYKKIVDKYDLNQFVFFYGYKFGIELDKIYNKIDIGVCELAPFRREYKISSSLKSREYLAKGLPIISAVQIDAFMNKEFNYILMLDKYKQIDFNLIKNFYKELYVENNINLVRQEIRKFAEDTIDIKKTMKPIVDYLSQEGK